MKDFIYLREYSVKDGINFKDLSLTHRLFASVILTKQRTGDKRTYGQILFDYSKYLEASYKDFEEFDKLVTSFLSNSYGCINDWINEHCSERVKAHETEDGKDNYYIHAITIEKDKLFTRKAANHQALTTRTGIANLAWKAAALAASNSACKVEDWRMLPIYGWIIDEVDINHLPTTPKSQIKKRITDWCTSVGIGGEFKGNYFIVDAKDFNKGEIRGGVKSRTSKEAC